MVPKNEENKIFDLSKDQYLNLMDFSYISEKIKKMRQSGLDSGGEFSVENIVFKVLRRNGMLDRLYDIKTVAYDKEVTLESIQESKKIDALLESLDLIYTFYFCHHSLLLSKKTIK